MIIHDAAVTGSLSLNGVDLSLLQNNNLATTGSNTFVGNQTITGSVSITGSLNINGASSIVGSLTSGYLSKSSTSTTLVNSTMYESGDFVGVGNRVTTNGSVGLIRNFNVLGTDAVLRVARFTDSYSTLSPSVELINYSNDGVYRRFYWDYFVNGDDNFAIRQRLTGGGLTTNGTVVDQVRLMLFNGGNVGIGTTTDVGFKFNVEAGGRVALIKQTAVSLSNDFYALDIDNLAHGSNMTTAGAFRIATNANSGAFVVNGIGNVGIGTTSPQALLHLASTTPGIYIDDTFTSGTRTRFRITTGDIGTTQAALFQFDNTSGTNLITTMIVNELGNVGIGTTDPFGKLQVESDDYSIISYSSSTSSSAIYGENTNAGIGIEAISNSGTGLIARSITGDIASFFGALGGQKVTFKNNGNVLIGTTTDSGAKLNVNGGIRTSNPSGGTSAEFKIGQLDFGSPGAANSYIKMDIGGFSVKILVVS